MIFSRSVISVAILGCLGGCVSLSSSDSGCIKTVLVSTLSRVPLHTAMGDDPRSATISLVKSGCGGSNIDLPGEKRDIGMNLLLTVPEARKESGRVKKITFPIFVALLDREDNVIDRHDENIEVTITNKALSHTHKTTYHLPEGIDVGSDDHRILVGFKGNALTAHSIQPHTNYVKKKTRKKKIVRL